MTSGSVGPTLECRELTVAYGSAPVLRALDLRVGAGEAVALLGPSGSGKTTLLYTVAGFVQPQSGEVWLDGGLVGSARLNLPAERRNVGMVFQNYALWPHLSALETVAYPLRRRGMAQAEADRGARLLLERMDIAHLARRRPHELSGGQQQRVGLARALAREPRLFLFDEPTAHLDIPLRAALQDELAERRRESGAAGLYATHDAGEALAVADRVALLREGRLVQLATPIEIYERPVDRWAAQLTGPASAVGCRLERIRAGDVELTLGDTPLTVPGGVAPGTSAGAVTMILRPDWTRLGGPLNGRIVRLSYHGSHTDYRLDTVAGSVIVRESGAPRGAVGDLVHWSVTRVWLVSTPDDHGAHRPWAER